MPPRRKPSAYRRKPKRQQSRFQKGVSVAQKALSLARKVADAVNTEYKFVDNVLSPLTVDWNGIQGSLMQVNPAQGLADNQRIGDSIKLQNFTFKYQCSRNTSDSIIRVIIFEDKQNKIASVANLLSLTGTINAVTSPKNYDTRYQTRILYDKCHILSSDNTTVMASAVLPLNWHTQFNAGTQTVNTGDLKICYISNVSGVPPPTFSYYSRLTFTDN